jgi:hypothetical protein
LISEGEFKLAKRFRFHGGLIKAGLEQIKAFSAAGLQQQRIHHSSSGGSTHTLAVDHLAILKKSRWLSQRLCG